MSIEHTRKIVALVNDDNEKSVSLWRDLLARLQAVVEDEKYKAILPDIV